MRDLPPVLVQVIVLRDIEIMGVDLKPGDKVRVHMRLARELVRRREARFRRPELATRSGD